MTTQKTIAKEVMREIKALSEVGVVVINRADLEVLINNAIQSGVELGREQAEKKATKALGLSLRTKSVPFDDEDDSPFDGDADDDPDCGSCTKGDPDEPDDDGEEDFEGRQPYDDQ